MDIPKLKRALRTLVLVQIGCGVGTLLALVVEFKDLPAALRMYVASTEQKEQNAAEVLILVVGVPLGITSVIGLCALWRSARFLYTTCVILGLALMLLDRESYVVMGPLASVLDSLCSIAGGITLGLLYFSPLKAVFEEPGPACRDREPQRRYLPNGSFLD